MPIDQHTTKSVSTGSDTENQGEAAIDSNDLFKGRKEIVIRHNQDRYVLRITRQGKLILNK